MAWIDSALGFWLAILTAFGAGTATGNEIAPYLGTAQDGPSGNWEAHADGRLVGPDGQIVKTSAGKTKHTDSLAAAMGLIGWGADDGSPEVIEVHGDHTGGTGQGLYLSQKLATVGHYASNPNGTLGGMVIRGATPDARIGAISIHERFGEVASLSFEDLAIDARGSQHGVIVAQGIDVEDLSFVNCSIESGTYTKWGFRFHGRVHGVLLEDCEGGDLIEHFAYMDNAWWVEIRGCKAWNCWRTMIQVVNRVDSGPSGGGDVHIIDCHATDCGRHGGGAFTIAGHLGTVTIRRCSATSPHDTYALVAWGEGGNPKTGKIGAHRDAEGYAISELFIYPRQTFSVPKTKRGCVAISATRSALVAACAFDGGPKPDLQLAMPGLGGGPNGSIQLMGKSPSTWAGWSIADGSAKVRNQGQDLTDAQVNALAFDRPAGGVK